MNQQNAQDRAFLERLIAMRADYARNNVDRGPIKTDLRAETRRQLGKIVRNGE
jgi:hypothetical protein